MHAMASFGNGIVMHGGFDGGNVLGDTWIFSMNGNYNWSPLDNSAIATSERPMGRILHQITGMGGQKLLLFGGQTSTVTQEVYPKDTWIFYRQESVTECGNKPECFTWKKLDVNGPDPRARHAMFFIDDNVIMYGGKIQQIMTGAPVQMVANDVWKFNIGEKIRLNFLCFSLKKKIGKKTDILLCIFFVRRLSPRNIFN
jgi:hypothetical protein